MHVNNTQQSNVHGTQQPIQETDRKLTEYSRYSSSKYFKFWNIAYSSSLLYNRCCLKSHGHEWMAGYHRNARMAGAMRVNGWLEVGEKRSWKLDKVKYHCLIHFTSLLSHFLRIWNIMQPFFLLSWSFLENPTGTLQVFLSIIGDFKSSGVNNEDGDHILKTDLKFPNTWVVF